YRRAHAAPLAAEAGFLQSRAQLIPGNELRPDLHIQSLKQPPKAACLLYERQSTRPHAYSPFHLLAGKALMYQRLCL
ncbi:MAG TPA: hypothetical protein VJ739_06045, partial [Gemmataceae bacterium]|nr:hypothetical protein [Gemmataceae bacterium]